AVFVGGWTLAAAEAAGADPPPPGTAPLPDGPGGAPWGTLPGGDADRAPAAWDPGRVEPRAGAGLLGRLVRPRRRAAQACAPATSALRDRRLETVREYAAERLADRGQAAVGHAGQRHAAYFTALAEQATPHLLGHGQRDWLRRIALEHDNFRAALEWDRAQG